MTYEKFVLKSNNFLGCGTRGLLKTATLNFVYFSFLKFTYHLERFNKSTDDLIYQIPGRVLNVFKYENS